MAYNNSGTLTTGQTYTLGDYTFQLLVSKITAENITSVQCNCNNGETTAQNGILEHISVNVKSWRVEANDTTADAYATLYRGTIDTGAVTKPIPSATEASYRYSLNGSVIDERHFSGATVTLWRNGNVIHWIAASESAGAAVTVKNRSEEVVATYNLNITQSYAGKTVYYESSSTSYPSMWNISALTPVCNDGENISGNVPSGNIAWYMVYGDPAFEKEALVARFAIDIADAGGGSWDDPGSTGDVSKTLNVTVTGALSGRHNDPLNDTSYAYTPSDQDAATVYGSGGDGGHGGGGGAGASTVVIHTIATERAGSVDYTAKAKRHGYGSGGGKGGKGADGCILVYY